MFVQLAKLEQSSASELHSSTSDKREENSLSDNSSSTTKKRFCRHEMECDGRQESTRERGGLIRRYPFPKIWDAGP